MLRSARAYTLKLISREIIFEIFKPMLSGIAYLKAERLDL